LDQEGEAQAKAYLCASCNRAYPVVDGVPRMMVTAAGVEPAAASFGYQWSARNAGRFETETLYGLGSEQELGAFLKVLDMKVSEIKGKIILDAGCGDGALLSLLGEHGAHAIGIDINTSIAITHERCRQYPNVAVLQADIMRPCIRQQSVDILWCEGVIVHTSEPRNAFQVLARLVKPGGRLFLWTYSSERLTIYQRIRDWLVAPYLLPRPLLLVLSKVIAVALLPWMRATGRKRSLSTLAFDLFDNLSPRYQWRYTEEEVRSMFREAGFVDLRSKGVIGIVGTRSA
jgi:ubiquinone/menaquinone biosynthesis C-methylase UbiE